MFAVIETGGKQYRVEKGQVLDVELLENPDGGERVAFDRVLLIYGEGGTRVGNPVIPGARVEATRLDAVRGPKVRIFKHKRRKAYRRSAGHRQDYTRVRVDDIVL
ncbi:MAG TPA: 50S ribosomal protein L21 [Thermoanaerobaculia bacterium]|nr:50S ribosomal protein L21 [Thermoanaerobaculia bacterium]